MSFLSDAGPLEKPDGGAEKLECIISGTDRTVVDSSRFISLPLNHPRGQELSRNVLKNRKSTEEIYDFVQMQLCIMILMIIHLSPVW